MSLSVDQSTNYFQWHFVDCPHSNIDPSNASLSRRRTDSTDSSTTLHGWSLLLSLSGVIDNLLVNVSATFYIGSALSARGVARSLLPGARGTKQGSEGWKSPSVVQRQSPGEGRPKTEDI